MNAFLTWLAKSPVASVAKTFAAVTLGAAIADWKTGGALSLASWQTWVFAGVVSVGPTVVNALNPAYMNYGRTK